MMTPYQAESPRRQRACLPCTKAKARCHYENNEIGDGCDRCQRLKISCNPQTTKSLRKPRRVKEKHASRRTDVSECPNKGHRGPSLANSDDTSANPGSSSAFATEGESLSGPSSLPPHHQPNPGFGITWDQAQKAVHEFTTLFTAHFPFIILDHDITAHRLSVEKPLLFQTILMTALDFTSTKSLEIRKNVDAWIGQNLLSMQEGHDLGTLQGLIVYVAWANPHFYSDRRATQLLYIALGLAHSLGLTGHATADDLRMKSDSEIKEQQRAFLACYYLLSFNSFQFGRSNPLSSTYVQHCVESLEQFPEFPSDFIVVKLVKFRQFTESITAIYDSICDDNFINISYQLAEKRQELGDIMSNVALYNHKFLLLSLLYHCAFMQLHIPMTYVSSNAEATSLLQREHLQHCLQISHNFINIVKSISPDAALCAPFTTYADIFSMFIAMSRLLLVNIEGWDLKEARATVDLRAALNEFVAKLRVADNFRVKRLAAAATEYPSSYAPVSIDDEKHIQLRIRIKLTESIQKWLAGQGLFGVGKSKDSQWDTEKTPQPSTDIHLSPHSPPWNHTYFFESLAKLESGNQLNANPARI